jgi:hypothetical protein
VFLYGQTGSGKTYNHDAITRAAASTIFGGAMEDSGRELASVSLSVVEIYCESIRCLLTGREVALRQARGGGIVLEGAGEKVGALAAAEGKLEAWRDVWEDGATCTSSRHRSR